jgi:hypothetical protein
MVANASANRLSELQLRKLTLEKKIVTEKRRLRDQSVVRANIRAGLVGGAVLTMAEQGLLPHSVMRALQEELLDRVFGDNRRFEALQGSALDLTALLREISEPVDDPVEDDVRG